MLGKSLYRMKTIRGCWEVSSTGRNSKSDPFERFGPRWSSFFQLNAKTLLLPPLSPARSGQPGLKFFHFAFSRLADCWTRHLSLHPAPSDRIPTNRAVFSIKSISPIRDGYTYPLYVSRMAAKQFSTWMISPTRREFSVLPLMRLHTPDLE